MKLLILLSVLSLSLLACGTPIGDVASSLGEDNSNGTPAEGDLTMTAREVRTELAERQQDANAARWRAHDGTKYRFWGTVTSVTPKEVPSLWDMERGGCVFGINAEGGACQSEWLTEVTVGASQKPLVCLFKGDAPADVVELDIGTPAALEGKFNMAWTDFANDFVLYNCRVIENNFQPTPTLAPTPIPTPTPLPFAEFEGKANELTSSQDFRTMLVNDGWRVLRQDTAFREAAGPSGMILNIPDKGVAFNALLRLYEANPNDVSLIVTCWENGGSASMVWVGDQQETFMCIPYR